MTYEYEGKTEKEAIEKAATELGLERDQFDVEILESQKNSLFKKGFVKIRVHVEDAVKAPVNLEETRKASNPLPQGELEEKLIDFIKDVISKMGYEAKAEVMFREDKKVNFNRT